MSAATTNNAETERGADDNDFLSRIKFRKASPTDILRCVEMVKKEPRSRGMLFVSKNDLEYRQHFAANYYRCAVLQDDEHENDQDKIIGFITGIRLGVAGQDDDAVGDAVGDALVQTVPHDPNGPVLFLRSVIVGEEYRNMGVGKAMIQDYIETMRQLPKSFSSKAGKKKPISKIVALCLNRTLLPFCIACGFSVRRADKVARAATEPEKRDALRRAYFLDLPLSSPSDYGAGQSDDEYRCYIVDSFASAPGTGNPASVVLLRDDFDPAAKHKWMQKVAAEFNLAETAFCWPRGGNTGHNDSADAIAFFKNESHWNIRYFTPTVEMGLCGHATLASAAVLYQTLPSEVLPAGTAVVFHASEDILTMNLANENPNTDPNDKIPPPLPSPSQTSSSSSSSSSSSLQRVSKVSMDFPPKPTEEISTREEKATVRNMLKSAFSVELEPLYVGLSDIGDLLVELSPKAFNEIGYDSLNFKALCEWDGYYRGIVICCIHEPETDDDDAGLGIDFMSRFFAPKAGINEDPVTGSAHCSLGPYFAKKLKKDRVVGRQMSVRSGIVECEVSPDKVTLTGTAITTMSGTLFM